MDGQKCREGVQWGHVVPQGKSPKLVYDLGNVFPQCPNHNLMHYRKDPMYNNWYTVQWGETAFNDLCMFLRENTGKKYSLVDLEEMICKYEKMLEEKNYVNHNTKELVSKGYYGEIIRNAWMKDGKI